MLHFPIPMATRGRGRARIRSGRIGRLPRRGDDAAGHAVRRERRPHDRAARVSLNGNYQDARILPVLTPGPPTAMWNGFRRFAGVTVVPAKAGTHTA